MLVYFINIDREKAMAMTRAILRLPSGEVYLHPGSGVQENAEEQDQISKERKTLKEPLSVSKEKGKSERKRP